MIETVSRKSHFVKSHFPVLHRLDGDVALKSREHSCEYPLEKFGADKHTDISMRFDVSRPGPSMQLSYCPIRWL